MRNRIKKPEMKDSWKGRFLAGLDRQTRSIQNISVGAEKDLLIENLAMLVNSGLDIAAALRGIGDEVRSWRMKRILHKVRSDVEAGVALSTSLESEGILPQQVISLLRIGEQSGQLAKNLQVIVDQRQKEIVFKSRLRSAMAYPIIVLLIATGLGLGLTVFVLPRLERVFGSLNVDLPIVTRFLLATGRFMGEHGKIVVPAVVLGVAVLLYVLFGIKKTKWLGQWVVWHIPGVRRLIREVELARMGNVFGSLLVAGLPIVEALGSLREATSFYSYRKFYEWLADRVIVGESLKTAMKQYKGSTRWVPTSVQQMIIAGEQSGRLPEALEKIGSVFEIKTEATAKNVTTVLEPILLLVVWAVVATVALSIIMPIYGLLGGLEQARSGVATRPEQVEDSDSALVEESNTETVPETEEEEIVSDSGPVVVRVFGTPAGTLNVRSEPNTDAEIVTIVNEGEEYVIDRDTVDENGDSWYAIVLEEDETGEEIEGWVSGEFVQLIDDLGEIYVEENVEVLEAEETSEQVEGVYDYDFGEVDYGLTATEEANLRATLEWQLEQAVEEELDRRQNE